MIVVQRVLTEWTKQSRGAPGAVRRNAVAEAFALPRADRTTVLVHEVVAHEGNDFVARQTSTAHALPVTGALALDGSAGVRLEMAGDQLVVTGVTDVWSQCYTVFPRRSPGTVLRLAAGQWGRWRLNFRLWEDNGQSDWRYQKWVVNVAHLPGHPSAELFQSTGPVAQTDQMVKLSHPTQWRRRVLRTRHE